MNIAEDVTFDKTGHIERLPWLRKFFLSLVIILIASLSFGLGRLSMAENREGIKIEFDASLNQPQTASVINAVKSGVVASSKGKKYHYLHCPGAKQISEDNKIAFASPAAAEASGYTLAANCQSR